MNKSFNIKLWGVRGSTPCANPENMIFGGNTTCTQIQIEGKEELLILDCGTGFRNLGNMISDSDLPVKGRIFLTHPHWDHLQGFPFFKPFYDAKNTFRIHLPPQGEYTCKEILQGHMSSTFFPIGIDMLQANIDCETYYPKTLEFDDYSIEYMWAKHTVPTAIYKVMIGDQVVVFAPDNEISDNDKGHLNRVKAFIQDADVLIHDAQYDLDSYESKIGWGHSAWENVVDLAQSAGVKRLYLTHHDPDSSDDYLQDTEDRIVSMYSDEFLHIGFTKEGQRIKLPHVDQEKALLDS